MSPSERKTGVVHDFTYNNSKHYNGKIPKTILEQRQGLPLPPIYDRLIPHDNDDHQLLSGLWYRIDFCCLSTTWALDCSTDKTNWRHQLEIFKYVWHFSFFFNTFWVEIVLQTFFLLLDCNRWVAASRPFALRSGRTFTMCPRFVPGTWKNRRPPLKQKTRNMFPLLLEKPPAAREAATVLESPKVAGPSRGRKQGSPPLTDGAQKIKEEKKRKAGKYGNLGRPGHLCLSSRMCAPGSLMSSPCWGEIQIPFPQTGSGVRKASHPLMGNPRVSTQTTPSPQGAFYSLLPWW